MYYRKEHALRYINPHSNMFSYSTCDEKTNKNQKMLLLDSEVARTFLEVFGFLLFLFLRFILEKYVWYKTCSSDFALSNNKKFDWFRSRQDGVTELDIYPKTFASVYIKSSQSREDALK
jgi:hypothetical protein